jgi:hypothetical protein
VACKKCAEKLVRRCSLARVVTRGGDGRCCARSWRVTRDCSSRAKEKGAERHVRRCSLA